MERENKFTPSMPQQPQSETQEPAQDPEHGIGPRHSGAGTSSLTTLINALLHLYSFIFFLIWFIFCFLSFNLYIYIYMGQIFAEWRNMCDRSFQPWLTHSLILEVAKSLSCKIPWDFCHPTRLPIWLALCESHEYECKFHLAGLFCAIPRTVLAKSTAETKLKSLPQGQANPTHHTAKGQEREERAWRDLNLLVSHMPQKLPNSYCLGKSERML